MFTSSQNDKFLGFVRDSRLAEVEPKSDTSAQARVPGLVNRLDSVATPDHTAPEWLLSVAAGRHARALGRTHTVTE